MEKSLGEIAKESEHCIYDRPSLEAFADRLRSEQERIRQERPRLRPVNIDLRFRDPGDPLERQTRMGIGQISLAIWDVEREIYAEEH